MILFVYLLPASIQHTCFWLVVPVADAALSYLITDVRKRGWRSGEVGRPGSDQRRQLRLLQRQRWRVDHHQRPLGVVQVHLHRQPPPDLVTGVDAGLLSAVGATAGDADVETPLS